MPVATRLPRERRPPRSRASDHSRGPRRSTKRPPLTKRARCPKVEGLFFPRRIVPMRSEVLAVRGARADRRRRRGRPLARAPARPPAVCFAQGTDPDVRRAHLRERRRRQLAGAAARVLPVQPRQSAVDGHERRRRCRAMPIVLTWSVVPDGHRASPSAAASRARSRRPATCGPASTPSTGARRSGSRSSSRCSTPGAPCTGTSYQFVNDDGAGFPGSAGSGVGRGDVRIGGPPPGRQLQRARLQLLPEHRRHGDRHERLVLHEHLQRLAGRCATCSPTSTATAWASATSARSTRRS